MSTTNTTKADMLSIIVSMVFNFLIYSLLIIWQLLVSSRCKFSRDFEITEEYKQIKYQ